MPANQSYRPELREVFAQCWTDGIWLSGSICMAVKRRLLDHLNHNDAFLKLRNAALSARSEPIAFLALRLSAVGMVVPTDYEAMEVPNVTSHPVTCMMPGALITGEMQISQNLRVSDYLMRSPGFFVMRDCAVRVSGSVQLPVSNPVDLVLVNSERVTGVAERG
jgi:hypothetical protein